MKKTTYLFIHKKGLTAAEVVFSSLSTLDNVHKSSAITLKCHINGNPIDEVRWLKNGKPVSTKNGLLVIHHPIQNDNGYYKCMARNKIGVVVSEPYLVEIHANAHNSIHSTMYCEAKIAGTNHNEKSLVCRHKRTVRFHRKRSTSEVGSQLSQTSKRKKINVAEDNSATINCDGNRKGNQVSVRWKKDGKLIRQTVLNEPDNDSSNSNPMENPLFRDDGRITIHPKNGSITIASAMPSDAGLYEVS